MKKISYDSTFGMVDLAVYSTMMAQDNKEQIGRLKEAACSLAEPSPGLRATTQLPYIVSLSS